MRNDDIVTRLRNGLFREEWEWESNLVNADIIEAADEIEKWQSIAKMFYDRHENRRSCSLIISCKECDAYEKAVRGE